MKPKLRRVTVGCLYLLMFCTAESRSVELLQLDEDNFAELAPRGKECDWIYGDFVLRNANTIVVIAQPLPQRNANMTVRGVGGCIIDLTSRDDPNDQLSAYYPAGGYFLFEAGTKLAKSLPHPFKSTEQIEHLGLSFRGKPNPRLAEVESLQGLACELTYWMNDESPVVRIDTRIENTVDEVRSLKLFDVVRADRDFESGVDGPLNLFHTADYWWKQAYGTVGVEQNSQFGTTIQESGRSF